MVTDGEVTTSPLRPISEISELLPALFERYVRREATQPELAAEHRVHQASLSKAFRRMGAPSRSEREQELRARIVSRYTTDEVSVAQIAQETGLCRDAVRNHLHAAHVPLRTKAGQGALVLPDHVLTDDWVRTEAGAWVCGLIVTDGSLRLITGRGSVGQSPTLRIVLAEHDRDGVLAAARAFGLGEECVKTYRYTERVTQRSRSSVFLEFTHPKLWFLHHTLGMPLGDKTTIARLPDRLVQDRHAWRGVFDGDGTAWVNRNSTCLPEAMLTLTGASPVLHDQLADYAETLGISLSRHTRLRNRRWNPTTDSAAHAEPAARLADELYRDCTFTIARKRDRAWAVREARFGKPGQPLLSSSGHRGGKEWLARFTTGQASAVTLARESGRSYMTVQAWLRRLGADV